MLYLANNKNNAFPILEKSFDSLSESNSITLTMICYIFVVEKVNISNAPPTVALEKRLIKETHLIHTLPDNESPVRIQKKLRDVLQFPAID